MQRTRRRIGIATHTADAFGTMRFGTMRFGTLAWVATAALVAVAVAGSAPAHAARRARGRAAVPSSTTPRAVSNGTVPNSTLPNTGVSPSSTAPGSGTARRPSGATTTTKPEPPPDPDTLRDIKALVAENVAAFNAEQLDRYLATIDRRSEVYLPTQSTVFTLFERYDLKVTLESVDVTSVRGTVAFARVVQRTVRTGGDADFTDNRLTADWELHRSSGGWKLWDQLNVEIEPL